MNIYDWKPQACITLDPQVAGQRLEELTEKLGGVTPAEVVADATPEEAVLHPLFEWDDSVAAKAHREDQARHMLRSIRVVIQRPDEDEPPIVTRGFVVVEREESGRVYDQVRTVMSDAKLRAQVVTRALKELQDWMERYRGYQELSDMYEMLGASFRRRSGRRRPRPEDRPPA